MQYLSVNVANLQVQRQFFTKNSSNSISARRSTVCLVISLLEKLYLYAVAYLLLGIVDAHNKKLLDGKSYSYC